MRLVRRLRSIDPPADSAGFLFGLDWSVSAKKNGCNIQKSSRRQNSLRESKPPLPCLIMLDCSSGSSGTAGYGRAIEDSNPSFMRYLIWRMREEIKAGAVAKLGNRPDYTS
jgi:hypothetical protein